MQLGHMQVCILLQIDNHASSPPLNFFTGRMPFLPPNQQRQSTEGVLSVANVTNMCCRSLVPRGPRMTGDGSAQVHELDTCATAGESSQHDSDDDDDDKPQQSETVAPTVGDDADEEAA